MPGLTSVCNDVLAQWMAESHQQSGEARPDLPEDRVGVRFAFYGRVSTSTYQDRGSSAEWQREAALEIVAGRGVILKEFFDVGVSRRREWQDRPGAAALLAAVADPERGFDAIVVGEYERAFYGDQLTRLAPMLDAYGVHLWIPEMDGPVDFSNPVHQALAILLGGQSKREVLRSRYRVMAAMRAQAREQGRHLGGRPPYGYRLVDAGPHPNYMHAQWGRRLHRLEPDPATAPYVSWMFAQRLAGHSVASIAPSLNERSVPCPSRVDPDRNRHRSGEVWVLRTVAAILSNPRYTGRQVWNRQASDRDGQRAPGRVVGTRQWSSTEDWVISTRQVHPALVSEGDFVAAQAVTAVDVPHDGSVREYMLVGLLQCRVCGRRMESHWVHGRAGYRCRHGLTSATRCSMTGPKSLYVREDLLVAAIAATLPAPADTDSQDNTAILSEIRHVAGSVRSNGLVIVYDGTRWALQSHSAKPHTRKRSVRAGQAKLIP